MNTYWKMKYQIKDNIHVSFWRMAASAIYLNAHYIICTKFLCRSLWLVESFVPWKTSRSLSSRSKASSFGHSIPSAPSLGNADPLKLLDLSH